jgi:glycosyltransferase involved in cell wall biosynthesis
VKIRIEVSSLATRNISGVGNYTRLFTEALDNSPRAMVWGSYFNFLNRQVVPILSIKNNLEKNNLIPLRVYAKLQSYAVAPPFDLFRRRVDLTIFPNFATWPTCASRLRATVIHDLTYIRFPELVEEKNLAHLRRVVPRSIKKADFIITVSDSVKSELVKEFGLNSEQCLVTPIPPDPTYFIENHNEIHNKYGIPTQKYIFFMGNLEPRKNLPTLIEAYRLLPAAVRAEYSLILAGGKGWKTTQSQQAIDKARIAGEHVVHVGYVDQADASAFYQKASLFVMPSLYEGFGMPVLEAFASSTPVVAADIPVLREAGGGAALYADPSSPKDFAAKIHTILTDNAVRDKLNTNASYQLAKFSWDNNVKNILDYVDSHPRK